MGEPVPDQPAAGTPPQNANTSSDKPDWLVGAEDGVAAEFSRNQGAEPRTAPVIKLSRPTLDPDVAAAQARPTDVRPVPPAPAPGENRGEVELQFTSEQPAGPVPGSESLRLPTGGPRAKAAEVAKEPEKRKAWAAAASSVPSLRVERRKFERKADGPPQMDEEADEEKGFPDDDATPSLSVVPGSRPGSAAPASATPSAPKLQESWLLVAMDDVRTNRRTQLLIGTAVVLLLVWMFWPRDTPTASVRELNTNGAAFDGRNVTVRGRVGEVFSVGGGYAFYLHQGRDTMVVFTRSRQPESRKTITVTGSISTGFLDGRARQALFEGS